MDDKKIRRYRREVRQYKSIRKEAAIAQKLFFAGVGLFALWYFARRTQSGQQLFKPVTDMIKSYVYPARAEQYLPLFQMAEGRYQLPEGLLVRVAQQESGFDPNAKNAKSGAAGMMQIVPKWHPELSNPYDPVLAIPYAAKYLRQLYDQFHSWKLALAAYNWGPGNLQKYGISKAPAETRNYVAQITSDVPVA